MRNLFGVAAHPRTGHDNADDDFVGLAKKQNHHKVITSKSERELRQVMQVQG